MNLRPTLGILTTSYPRDGADYAGWFVAERALRAAAAGQRVEVITASCAPKSSGPPGGPAVFAARVAGVRLFDGAGVPEAFEASGFMRRLRARIEASLVTAAMTRLIHERACTWTVLESHWLLPCGLLGIAVAGSRPHVAYAHSGDVALLERMGAGSSLARIIARALCDLVFVSDDLRARFNRLLGSGWPMCGRVEAMPVAPARAPLEPRTVLRARLGLSGATVACAGRLVPIKGFDAAIVALGCLPMADRPGLMILGDGPERERLVRLARAVGVRANFLGSVPRGEVAGYLRAADLCVVPSRKLANGRREGMPLVPREALACGTPVVATSAGGLVELARAFPDQVLLVPAGDTNALARAIGDALNRGRAADSPTLAAAYPVARLAPEIA